MKKNLHTGLLGILCISFFIFHCQLLFAQEAKVLAGDGYLGIESPNLVIWFGDVQSFGQYGTPQRWVNLLGNVSDPDGIDSLYYTLNGGSIVMLSIGPDGRRLQSSGDFNIDLDPNDLVEGSNTVLVSATDNNNNKSEKIVTVNYSGNNVWPLPYTIDWQTTPSINADAQVVDGIWEITADGLHTVTTGYDRLVAIGDTTWADYEITVPVIIHSINNGNGVGILLRWMGHTDYPVSCDQPKCGYLPLGAICWYRGNKLEIYGNGGSILATQPRSLALETTYMFKARVETNAGVGGLYRFKVWEQGQPEPAGWDIMGQETLSDPQNGCLLLISHHGDVTFGNPVISAIPLSITNVFTHVLSGNTSATISWNTNIPANSQVAYGLDANYGLGTISDPTLKTSHSISLTGLQANTEYHFQITSTTAENDEVVTGDMTFSTVSSDIVSDDFHLPTLNTTVWTYVDPVGDCSYNFTGSNTEDAWLNFQLPAGTEHQLWTSGIQVPHIRQNCLDTDFEVEAKFESPLNLQYQEQGILIRQDDNTFLRFEFFSNTSSTVAYVASFTPGGHTTEADLEIGTTGIAPLYMRVKRQNDQWIMTYSLDGTIWTQSAIFNFAMAVNTVGPYAGNALGASSPAHTGSIDYFFNTAMPIDPEDPIGEEVMITSTPETEATINQLYTYDVEATGDPEPTYSLLTYPIGMTIDENTGLIEWTPDATGDFNVSVEASNTVPSSDIQNFTIHVIDIANGPASDDFNRPDLDETIWSFVDPLGGGGYTLSGTNTNDAWINISVPAGTDHELWENGIQAPHILQLCEDTDFELEVKFESSMSGAFQEQGILIKDSETHFLRFEFFSSATNTNIIAATLTPGSPTVYPLVSDIKNNVSIGPTGIAPLFMRINRTGSQWTQSYSLDGINWIQTVSFPHSLVVSAVGTYAGNSGNMPAHTSSVDYFFNTAAPIVPEDGPPLSLKVLLQGPYDAINHIMNTSITDNLPVSQPYDKAPWNYTGIESLIEQQVNILPLGNSVTQGDNTYYSYRYSLWTKLLDDGIDFDLVGSLTNNYGGTPVFPNYNGEVFDHDHEGHWGLRCDEILANLNTWLLNYSADLALLHLGTNDMFQGSGDPTNIAETIDEIEDIIVALRTHNPNMIILLAKLIPSTSPQLINKIPDLNAEIPQVAIDMYDPNSPIVIVDHFEGFDAATDTHDGVHPNAAGEEKMAQKWRDAIVDVLLDQNYPTAKNNAGAKDGLEGEIVDWVLVELRSDINTTVERNAALLRNDGIIVQHDNITQGVQFQNIVKGSNGYIIIWHRNHMPVMTASSIVFDGTQIDFTDESICYGSPNAEVELETGVYGMIAGDITGDGILLYSGPGNDRGPIIARIASESGTTNINASISDDYWFEDLNLNNSVLYTGSGNDRSLILENLNALTGTPYVTNLYSSMVPGAISDGPLKNKPENLLDLTLIPAQDSINIVLINNDIIQDGLIDNIQFTLSYFEKDKAISDLINTFSSEFLLSPQGTPIIKNGIIYQTFASVNPVLLPASVPTGDKIKVLSFTNTNELDITDRLWITRDELISMHNGAYYVSIWGNDHTGNILNSSSNVGSSLQNTLHIFPNPVTNGILNIEIQHRPIYPLTIRIHDIYGRTVLIESWQTDMTQQLSHTLNVETLSQGAYILSINNGHIHYREIFIKK